MRIFFYFFFWTLYRTKTYLRHNLLLSILKKIWGKNISSFPIKTFFYIK
nr:MAG TPA: hypothetical protein [Caudoviricetes sp.]